MASVLPIFFVIAAGLCIALVLLALWQSLRLLLAPEAAAATVRGPANRARATLLREKQELLGAIRDLRFEHELGKVSDADFSELEQRYRARAREVLRELDAQIDPHREKAQALIEATLGKAPVSVAFATTAAASAKRECVKCSAPNDDDALFCKKCGARIGPEAAS